MSPQNPPNAPAEAWLKTLGVESLCQWDVLVFLHRHPTSLVGADHLSRLLGYGTDAVVATLDVLESLGFVDRSRVSQGARLYQLTVPPLAPRREAFEQLLALAGHRSGRLVLAKLLRQAHRPPREKHQASRSARGTGQRGARRDAERDGRRDTWRTAI